MAAPKLRFKEFDGDWNKNTIGNFVLNYKGGASLTPADFVEYSDCEVIPKKAISSGGLLQLDKVVPTFCTLEFFNSNQNYIVDSEYLITTLRDLVPSGPSIGYIVKYESNKKYILAQGVYGFRIKNDLNRDFLIQFSNTSKFRLHMQSIMVGSTQVHIRNQDYFSTELYTPSLLEQTKIASFLSTVDEKISQLTQKHELLSQYKQGMMQKLFSQQIRFKADDGSEFGEWKKVKFSDKFKFHQTNSYSRALLSEQGEIMNIHYGDIHTKFSTLFDISKEVVPFLSSEVNTNKFAEDQFLQVGDLVIADASEDYKDIGKALEIIHLNNQKVVAGLHTYIARPVQPFALGFCGYLMQTFEVREQIKKLATGISVLGISKTNIGKVEIKVPCLEEQTKIANFLSAIDQKIEVVAQQIEQAKQWKKGLLQQMFV
ncbi:restriction endonuclease subunit S [Acinetobacter baumannii]|uniref:restriction endonuclease subunit S n=1 Tax=Acinetobacter calcoaceticus/baumannii complex TaxID=909768 RepID=UPI00124D45C8|nr:MULTISPECIES: restriction endonuclease subunit S [Acinetobacter calcoaceticus/baumannii complex]HDX5840096.1 restriction endonuclease subunit S [Acinetobacter baumannii]